MYVSEIAVFPAEDLARRGRLLGAIGELYGVRFIADNGERPACDAAVFFSATRDNVLAWMKRGVRCLAFLDGPTRAARAKSSDLCFSDTLYLSPLFRGRKFADSSIETLTAAEPDPTDEIIAEKGGDCVWLYRRQGASAADLVATRAPSLDGSDYLFEHFREDNWAALLPLLHFVSEVSGWTLPPLRACFMFDDPNLHWGSYGYVKYRQIVEGAKAEHYHTSFATVPMDTWFVHAATARLFRENLNHLSLLIHGNDHTFLELQKPRRATATAVAAQALDRITRFERKSGISVSRVMAAPHGACSEAAAKALLKTGFDAACISVGSLMTRNPDIPWPVCVGMRPAEFFGSLPVIPRINIRLSSDVPARLGGFLGQPIIPVGHHEDLRNGLAMLSRSARLINSIDQVRWMDMKSIAELNYFTRVQGSVLEVRMYARRIRITVPSGVTHLSVQRPWLCSHAAEDLMIQTANKSAVTYSNYRGQPLEVVVQADLTVRSIDAGLIDPSRVPLPQPSLHAIIRRQLCEARDRLRPTFDRLLGTSSQPWL